MAILIRIHESSRKVVAVCDANLLGKKFVEGMLQLDIKDTFYGGKQMNHAQAVKLMWQEIVDDATFNIVGEESIKAAIEAEIIADSEDSIIRIQGIPHAMSLL
jgi:hypothetical protein